MAGGASGASFLQFSYYSYSFVVFCDPSTVTDNKKWWLYPLAMYPCPIITCHLCNCPPTVPMGIHPIMKHNGFLGYQENGQCEGWLQLLVMNKWLAGQKNTGTELQRLVEIQILDSAVFRKVQKSAINNMCVKTPNCHQGVNYYQTLKLSSALATAVTEIKGKNQSCKQQFLQKQASHKDWMDFWQV